MNGSCSPACCMTKCRRHFWAILMKVSHAMSCTPVPKSAHLRSTWGRSDRLTFVRFVHELEQLVDDRFEKLPVRLQEPRILPDNVHDIRRADGFVILAALHFGQAKEILDDSDQEPFLRLLVCVRASARVQPLVPSIAHSWRLIWNR